MKRDVDRSLGWVKEHLPVWFVLTVVLRIISVFEPLPFINIVAWLAMIYCGCLLIILLVLLIIKYR